MTSVNLGSGRIKKRGYINVDADPAVNPDVVAPATKLPFKDASVDVIEAFHLIEHLLPWDVESAVLEWKRVLKPGGRVVVECPDLAKAVRWLARNNEFSAFASRGFRPLFGEVAGHNAFMTHRWGFTPVTLSHLFNYYGFAPVSVETPVTHVPDRDLRVIAHKPAFQANPTPAPRVHWFLWAGRETASARLQGYHTHAHLAAAGVSSEIILAPPVMLFDTPWHWEKNWQMTRVVRDGIAVFVKLRGAATGQLMQNLRDAGAWVVYVDCDLEPQHRIGLTADLIVCPTEELASHYRSEGARRVVVIPDVVDYWLPPEQLSARHVHKPRLTVGWVGSASNWPTLGMALAILAEPEFSDLQLLTVSDFPDANVKWRLDEMPANLARMDIGIIPTSTEATARVKSNNRLTLFMAAGVPVIAGRIPAYQAEIREGVNGFHADTADEFRQALRRLRDPKTRSSVAKHAYEDAHSRYSGAVVGDAWRRLFEELAANPKPHGWLHGPMTESQRQTALRDARAAAYESLFRHVWKRGSRRRALSCLAKVIALAPRSPEARRGLAELAARVRSVPR